MEGFKQPEQLAEEAAIKEEERKVDQEPEQKEAIRKFHQEPKLPLNFGCASQEEEVKKTFSKNLTTLVTDLQNLNKKTKVFLILMVLALVMAFCALGFKWGGEHAAKFFIENCMCI